MGSILKRPDGRLVVQWVDGTGRQRQRTVLLRTLRRGLSELAERALRIA